MINKKLFLRLATVFLFHGMLFAINAAHAQSAAKANDTHREPQFENEFVRVWKTNIMPRQPLNIHRHDCSRVVVTLKGGPLQVFDGSGKNIKTYHWESGKAYWLDADPPGQFHGDINNTDNPIEVIVIELKK